MDEPGNISPPAADKANMLLRLIRAKGWNSTKGKLPKKIKKKMLGTIFSLQRVFGEQSPNGIGGNAIV